MKLPSFLRQIRIRFLLVNVLIVAVPLTGISFAHFYEREMLVGLENDMVHQGDLLRQTLLADPNGLALENRAAMLAAAARETRTRIRLLDAKGTLKADSHAQGPPEGAEREPRSLLPVSIGLKVESLRSAVYERDVEAMPLSLPLANRPEVKAALRGEYGSATRIWRKAEVDRVYLFSALPILRQGSVVGVVYVTRTTVPVRLAMRRLRKTLFEVLAGTLAATVVITGFLAGTISRPLTRLTRKAERIAAGERGVTLALDRSDEIGQLARAFETMAGKLDERARYVAELAANISHEFKSPLTSIRGAAELLTEGAADDPESRQRFLGNILADADRLDRLVSRLLELSRFESDSEPLAPLDFRTLVKEIAGRSRSHSPRRVVVDYAASSTLVGRRSALASALRNLIDNAEQHAVPGTPVTVTVRESGGRITVAVRNQGEPISEENLKRIWSRFFTTRAADGGTGLGLPIVRAVVTAHGGTVEVASTREAGTTFTFSLPVRPA